MKIFYCAGLLLTLSLTLSSCLISLQQLATYKTIITDDRLAGLWQESGKSVQVEKFKDSRYKNIFAEARNSQTPFSSDDSVFALKHYIITFREKEIDYTWVATLVSVGSHTFISLVADESTYRNEDIYPTGGSNFKGISFAKLEWLSDKSLQIRFIDGDYVKKMILSGKARVRHEYDPLFGTFIITASSEELRQFLEKYGDDERLFRGGNTINLMRKT